MVINIIWQCLFFLFLVSGGQSGVFCPLKWETGGFGSVPANPVFVTSDGPQSDKSEVLIRVFYNSFYRFGRLSRVEGLACIASGEETELKLTTYEVLTNPHGCVLTWDKSEGGVVPPLSVTSVEVDKPSLVENASDPIYYAGRIQFNFSSVFLAGNIMPMKGAIYVGYEGQEIVEDEYEALVSTYPKLHCELSDFTFDIGSPDFGPLEETFTGFELIGQDEIRNTIDMEVTQTIRHAKGFHETLILTEDDDKNWREIERLEVRLSLWFGSQDVEQVIDIGPEGAKTLRINRVHDVTLQKDVRIGSNKFIQVCSVAALLKNPVIPFTAIGIFSAEELKGSHVAAVLDSLGRRIIEQDGHRVVAEVKGKLSGRMFLRTLSFVSEKDERASCLSTMPKWANAY